MEMARKESQGSKLYIRYNYQWWMQNVWLDWKLASDLKYLIFFTVDLIDNVCDSTQNQHSDQKGVF